MAGSIRIAQATRQQNSRNIPSLVGPSAIIRNLPIVLLYSLIIPAGLRFQIGTVLLYPFRIVLILAIPILLSEMARTRFKPVVADYLMLFSTSWMLLTLIYHLGLSNGLESGVRESIDYFGGYLVARVCIRRSNDIERLLLQFLPGIFSVGLIFLIESVTNRLLIYPILPFAVKSFENLYQYRLGLMRAWGPFQHPILGGMFLATFFPLYFTSILPQNSGKRLSGIIASLGGFFSLSSGAILTLLMNFTLSAYIWVMMRLTRSVPWNYILVPAVVFLVLVEVLTNSGVARLVIRYLSLTPSTGFFRVVIWEHGSASVAQHPFLGIGYEGYERANWMRSGTVDNHWLALALRFGIPVPAALIAAMYCALRNLAKGRVGMPLSEQWASQGLTIALFSAALALVTVLAWLQTQVWVMMILGAAVGLSQGMEQWKRAARRTPFRPASLPDNASNKRALMQRRLMEARPQTDSAI